MGVRWCGARGGLLLSFKESIDKHVYVKIESSDKCVRDGDLKITITRIN